MSKNSTITFMGAVAGAALVGPPRIGLRHLGFPSGGPADPEAAKAANQLVGNPADHPVFELPLRGGKWLLRGDNKIALTGAIVNWRTETKGLSQNQMHALRGETQLTGSWATAGRYAYLAIQGLEISDPKQVAISNVEVIIPGKCWRSKCGESLSLPIPKIELLRPVEGTYVIQAHPGPELRKLSEQVRRNLLESTFQLRPQSNRIGLRLREAAKSWQINLAQMISVPVLPGTVQLTPSGPIILGPDAQTIGGYPRIFQLEEAQLAKTYQLSPGSSIAFQLV